MPGIAYRHPVKADMGALTQLFNESRKGLPFHRTITIDEMDVELFRDSDYDPEGAWIAEEGDVVVGYGDAVIDSARLAYGGRDSEVTIEVSPESRGKGADEELLGRTLEFIKGRGLGAALGWCFQGDDWKRNLFESSGFSRVHEYFSMVRKEGMALPPAQTLGGLALRHRMLKDTGEDEMTEALEVVNEAFSELFNYSPWTIERFVNYRDTAEEELLLTFATLNGELAGVSICEDSAPYNKQHGLKDGWINIIAVQRDFRRRGIGRALILDGMHWLIGRGLPVIHLGVDAENEKALGLYTSLGFEVMYENAIYMKKLQ